MPDSESGSANTEMTKIDSFLMNHRMLFGRGSGPGHTII